MTANTNRTLDLSSLHKKMWGNNNVETSKKIAKIQNQQCDQYFKLGDSHFAIFEFLPEVSMLQLTNNPPLVYRRIKDGEVVDSFTFRDSLSPNTAIMLSRKLDDFLLNTPLNGLPNEITSAAEIYSVSDFFIIPGGLKNHV